MAEGPEHRLVGDLDIPGAAPARDERRGDVLLSAKNGNGLDWAVPLEPKKGKAACGPHRQPAAEGHLHGGDTCSREHLAEVPTGSRDWLRISTRRRKLEPGRFKSTNAGGMSDGWRAEHVRLTRQLSESHGKFFKIAFLLDAALRDRSASGDPGRGRARPPRRRSGFSPGRRSRGRRGGSAQVRETGARPPTVRECCACTAWPRRRCLPCRPFSVLTPPRLDVGAVER